MKLVITKNTTLLLLALCSTLGACTKLDQKVYSVVPNQNFWQTPDQIAAGIAPAYAALTVIPDGNFQNLQETSSDEQVVPARGSDWLADGQHIALWTHTWNAQTQQVVDTWTDLYGGIGKINFILGIVNTLSPAPPNLNKINAELKTLRALYYYWTMDLYGNIPLVTDFNTNPNTVTNSTRADVFNFIEKELKANIDLLTDEVSPATYGRVTKWTSFCLLAKLYLNAGVYTGTPRWADAISMCDSVIASGKYSLQPNYFDNFSQNNESSVENIFVIPFDHVNIGGENYQTQNLHYQNNINFQLSSGAWNGFCSNAEFYSHYDTTSVYTVKGPNTYRTFLDARSGQYLIGQQFSPVFTYPPNTNVLVASTDPTLKIRDAQTGKNLSFYANITEISNPSDTFRLAGLRNIKYFPNPGTQVSMNNDVPVFRLADILLMRAEAALRNNTATGTDLGYVNSIRTRAYAGDASHNWTMTDLTLPHILDERARELAWENVRRQDCIRFGTFANARIPNKTVDADNHWQIFPIPQAQHDANPNLKQNPGYPAF
jgi:hypothetical protein